MADGGCATVNAAQDVTRFSAQVPAQRESMQVSKQPQLHGATGVLLDACPQERTHVTDKA